MPQPVEGDTGLCSTRLVLLFKSVNITLISGRINTMAPPGNTLSTYACTPVSISRSRSVSVYTNSFISYDYYFYIEIFISFTGMENLGKAVMVRQVHHLSHHQMKHVIPL